MLMERKTISSDMQGDPTTCTIPPQHGVQIRGPKVFPAIKIIGLSCACVTCVYCGLWRSIYKMQHIGQSKCGHTCFCVVGKHPMTPNFSPMAGDAIIWSDIRSGMSLAYLWLSPNFWKIQKIEYNLHPMYCY